MKKECYHCGYWTREDRDPRYKCYAGDCPAKVRDTKIKQSEYKAVHRIK